jgi:hypothetical protein
MMPTTNEAMKQHHIRYRYIMPVVVFWARCGKFGKCGWLLNHKTDVRLTFCALPFSTSHTLNSTYVGLEDERK